MKTFGHGEEVDVPWPLETKGLPFSKKTCLDSGSAVIDFCHWVTIFSIFILEILPDFCSSGPLLLNYLHALSWANNKEFKIRRHRFEYMLGHLLAVWSWRSHQSF